MKHTHYALAVLTALLLIGCNSTTDDTIYDYQLMGLNRPVQMVQVKAYEAVSKFGEVTKGNLEWYGHYSASFNEVGNLDVVNEYDDDGDLYCVERFKYNEVNKLTEQCTYDSDGDLNHSIHFEYDANGNIVKQTTTEPHWSYWGDSQTIRIVEYTIEDDSVKEERYSKNGELLAVLTYSKNDKTGSEFTIYDNKSDKSTNGHRLYNEQGRLVEEDFGEGYVSKAKWNEKNLPVHTENYDIYRNTLLSPTDGEVYFIEYEYDQQGNWVKQIIYEGVTKKPATIYERTITY
ncbi:MAG: hypothetical protein J6U53_01485 [Tidjanibacter sp.]|nr:hypothetical protein [Tidjanibacter sp.]